MKWIRHLTKCDNELAAISKGVKEGGEIHFTEGPLVGMEGFVQIIDRHKRTVTLKMEFFGKLQRITVSAEIINGAEVK